ncbi:hypothetical protein ACSRUE_05115 [Sorangium sp. KYC3313]|uniref:hypothetical protein n=1 Tax=Sorangium sp. KYC3313 TaxID=3449740 RepID=UPI003F89859E
MGKHQTGSGRGVEVVVGELGAIDVHLVEGGATASMSTRPSLSAIIASRVRPVKIAAT